MSYKASVDGNRVQASDPRTLRCRVQPSPAGPLCTLQWKSLPTFSLTPACTGGRWEGRGCIHIGHRSMESHRPPPNPTPDTPTGQRGKWRTSRLVIAYIWQWLQTLYLSSVSTRQAGIADNQLLCVNYLSCFLLSSHSALHVQQQNPASRPRSRASLPSRGEIFT